MDAALKAKLAQEKGEKSVSTSPDQRRHERVLIGGTIDVGWTNERGESTLAKGKCIDVSEGGMQVELRVKVPVGTIVNLRAQEARFHGSGSVRYCRVEGLVYHVGLGFVGGMKRDRQKPGG